MPPYFKQDYRAACGLTSLRMALAFYGIDVTEAELLKKVESDYGKRFNNIWNPTIAKLASEYGIKTSMYALWPLFKKPLLRAALSEFKSNPEQMDVSKYENPNDSDDAIPEPLPLAYKEMFKAVELGCKTFYGSLTARRIRSLLGKGCLIHTSIRLKGMYPEKKLKGYHVLLLYKADEKQVTYHDPYHGASLNCTYEQFMRATTDVGAAIVFEGKKQG